MPWTASAFLISRARYAAGQHPEIGSQSAFLTDGDHRVDCIFRYEDIASFVDFLETRLDCAIELPRINVPPSVDVHLPDRRGAAAPRMARDLDVYASLHSRG